MRVKKLKVEKLLELFPEEVIVRALERELLTKKALYEKRDREMREKYGMDFERAERELLNLKGHTWEVERDLAEWEHAVEGIESCNELLKEIEKWKASSVQSR